MSFQRKSNPKLFDAKYLPDGNKIINEWFERTQTRGLSWPEGRHAELIKFTPETNEKFDKLTKKYTKDKVIGYKNTIKKDIYQYLRGFNNKGFEQIAGTPPPWSLEKSIEHGMKQAVQTLIYQGLNKYKYYRIDARNKDGKLTGYGTRGGGKCIGKLCPSKLPEEKLSLVKNRFGDVDYSTLSASEINDLLKGNDEIIKLVEENETSYSDDEQDMLDSPSDWDSYNTSLLSNVNKKMAEELYNSHPGRESFSSQNIELSDNLPPTNPILRWFHNLRKKSTVKSKGKPKQEPRFKPGDIIVTNSLSGLSPDDVGFKKNGQAFYYVLDSEPDYDLYIDKIGRYQEHIQVYPYVYHYSHEGRMNKITPNHVMLVRPVYNEQIGQLWYKLDDKSTSPLYQKFKKEWIDSGKMKKVMPGGVLKGGTRRPMPEKPIVGYNYIINIYWPIGEGGPFTELRYENVEGKYMGLASEVFDGWVDDERMPIPPYVFKTNLSDCEGGCIGEIVRLIAGTPNIKVNVNGGRRKKRTRKSRRKRRKRKKKTRRKRKRKKKTRKNLVDKLFSLAG